MNKYLIEEYAMCKLQSFPNNWQSFVSTSNGSGAIFYLPTADQESLKCIGGMGYATLCREGTGSSKLEIISTTNTSTWPQIKLYTIRPSSLCSVQFTKAGWPTQFIGVYKFLVRRIPSNHAAQNGWTIKETNQLSVNFQIIVVKIYKLSSKISYFIYIWEIKHLLEETPKHPNVSILWTNTTWV